MPVFAYRARSAAGRTEHGVVDAESVRGAWQQLRARGVFPTELRPGGDAGSGTERVGAADAAAALGQLAALVRAGVPLADALEGLTDDASSPALGRALTLVRARVREGAPLADALASCPRVFSPLQCELVRAGEASGALDAVLARLARDGAALAARRARLRAALLYPSVMLAVTTLVLGFLLAWVVPEVTRLFVETGAPLPLATRVLVGGAAVVRATWWLWLGLAALATVACRRWYATAPGRRALDGLVIATPVVGPLVAALAAGRVTRILATMLRHGMPLDRALALAAGTSGNARVAAALDAVRADVLRGGALAPSLRAHGILGAALCRLVATGERTGALGDAFDQAADAEDARVERVLATALGLVEPVLVVVMGGAVLLLVLAILVPILTLNPIGAHG
jgi:general secretion pathway protein F